MDYSLFSIIDAIFIVVGVYAFYTCYLMKTTGDLKTKLLLGEGIEINKCKDKKGYINYIFPKLFFMGIISSLYGASGLIDSYVTSLGYISLLILVILVVYLIWFTIICKKAVKIFW